MRRRRLLAAAGLACTGLVGPARGQGVLPDGAVEVRGQVRQPVLVQRNQWAGFAPRTFTENRTITADGREMTRTIRYEGVLLRDLIDRAGLLPERRVVRRAVVLLTARDGYQASFSWGELYNSALGDGVIVVLRESEENLLETDGLPAVRSLQDTRSGPRHVRWLARVEVLLP